MLWTDYEYEETQMVLDMSDMVLGEMVNEIVRLAMKNENRKFT